MTKTDALMVGVLAVALTGLFVYNFVDREDEMTGVIVYGDVSRIFSASSAATDSKVAASQANTSSAAQQKSDIPSEEETVSSASLTPPDGGWNINTATTEQLLTVEGMSRQTAEEIIRFRAIAGRFEALEELRNVKGVSDTLLYRIIERFYCG